MIEKSLLVCELPLNYELVSPYNFLRYETGEKIVTLKVTDNAQQENTYTDAFLQFTQDQLSL